MIFNKKFNKKVEERLEKLEKFKKQTECPHPIEKREIHQALIISVYEERCAECGKVIDYYYSPIDAYKAKKRILSEQIEENEKVLSGFGSY